MECIDVKCGSKDALFELIIPEQRKTFIGLMGSDIRSALASKVVLLDRIKNVSTFVRVVLDVGKEVSEVMVIYWH